MTCRWYNKELENVTENEQEKCYEQAGRECLNCEELIFSNRQEETQGND